MEIGGTGADSSREENTIAPVGVGNGMVGEMGFPWGTRSQT